MNGTYDGEVEFASVKLCIDGLQLAAHGVHPFSRRADRLGPSVERVDLRTYNLHHSSQTERKDAHHPLADVHTQDGLDMWEYLGGDDT